MTKSGKILVGDFKAYEVTDGDEGWAIVYATSGVAARRLGANEIDCEFESVERCRRVKSLDEYGGTGAIPVDAMLALDWHFECAGCGREIKDDDESWDYELDRPRSPIDPVGFLSGYGRDRIFCTPECRDETLEEELWVASAKELAVRRVTAALLRVCPAAVVVYEHAHVDRHCRTHEVCLDFTFPGSRYRSGFRYRPAEDKHGEVYIANGDLAAWDAYAATLKETHP